MYKLILIFILGINIYANENKNIDEKFSNLEQKINKIEQKNILLENENIKLIEKINNIEEQDKFILIKEFVKELSEQNSNFFANIMSFIAIIISFCTIIWTIRFKDSERLKVLPMSIKRYEDRDISYSAKLFDNERDNNLFAIKISNLSFFPVYVSDINFVFKGKKIVLHHFYDIYESEITIPFKIESKDSILIHFNINHLKNKIGSDKSHLKKVRVELKSGKNFKGTSKAFEELIKSF